MGMSCCGQFLVYAILFLLFEVLSLNAGYSWSKGEGDPRGVNEFSAYVEGHVLASSVFSIIALAIMRVSGIQAHLGVSFMVHFLSYMLVQYLTFFTKRPTPPAYVTAMFMGLNPLFMSIMHSAVFSRPKVLTMDTLFVSMCMLCMMYRIVLFVVLAVADARVPLQ